MTRPFWQYRKFWHVTFNVTFDLLLKNFNICHNFFILRDGVFIFCMCPLWQGLSDSTVNFEYANFTMSFDLILTNFNICHNKDLVTFTVTSTLYRFGLYCHWGIQRLVFHIIKHMFLASRDECPGSLCHSPTVRVGVGVCAWTKTLTLAIIPYQKWWGFHIAHVYSLWQDLSHGTIIFDLVTLTLKFDLLLKNFNLCCYLVMVAAWRASLSSDFCFGVVS